MCAILSRGLSRRSACLHILRIGMNLDGAQDGYAKGTRGHNVSYTIPYGAHTFTLSYQRSKYHQTVESRPYDFISAGDTNISTFSWDYALHRSASMKTSLDIRLRKCNSHSFINDVEIPIQAMQSGSISRAIRSISVALTVSVSAGWAHRRRNRILMHQRRAIACGSSMWIMSIRLLSVIGLQHSRVPYTDSGR